MTTYLQHLAIDLRWRFWRITAALLGWAVAHRRNTARMVEYWPYLLLGLIAFLAGRWAGGLMLSVP